MSIRERSLDIFREEAFEHLDEMENLLLALEESPENEDLVQCLFRTVHTLKGSSAMFSFDNLAMLAHMLEDVFDQLRKGRMEPDQRFMEIALSSKDVMSAMVAELDDSSADFKAQTDNLIVALRKFLSVAGEEALPPAESPASPPSEQNDEGVSDLKTYRIRFRPEKGVFRRGINLFPILEDLKGLGNCDVNVLTKDLPLLEDMVPLDCYLAWDIVLSTDRGENAIRDVFMFVEDGSEISVEVLEGTDGSGLEKGKKESTENRLSPKGPASTSSIRVSAEKLNSLINLVGEIVTVQAGLGQFMADWEDFDMLTNRSDGIYIKPEQVNKLFNIAERMERLVDDLRDNAMSIRMLPIGVMFNRFRRLVRDLSASLGKEVRLITEGGKTELDKTVIEKLVEPLIHIIRNCVDHGIEMPDERESMGKPRMGTVRLHAEHSGGNVLIHISDDGKGFDLKAIEEKAISLGLIDENHAHNDLELVSLIFHAGFSTARQVSDVSGRGVGMDVVKKSLDSLSGAVRINPGKPGEGTSLTFSIPLTMAIIDGLLVGVGQNKFIFPLTVVEECIELTAQDIAASNGRNLAHVREDTIPYINLREVFEINGDAPEMQQIVITGGDGTKIGYVVDNVIGQNQTVIKTLGGIYKNLENISGASILGDGSVALILDTNKLSLYVEAQETRQYCINNEK